MSERKIFRGLMFLYIVILSFFVGLIIQKFTNHPIQLPSPNVSFQMDNSSNVPPEKLVTQLHEWMQLDSSLTKSILAEGIPLNTPGERPGLLALVVEPQNLLDYFIYWTVGIDLGKPATYLASSLPRLDPYTRENIQAGTNANSPGETYYSTPKKSQVIQGDSGTIFINVPREEMLKAGESTKAANPVNSESKVENPPGKQTANNPPTRPETNTQPAKSTPPKETKRKPRVLIYHTHSTETYSDDFRAHDTAFHVFSPNVGRVVTVGDELARALEAEGIEVYHDKSSYDSVFNRAYTSARKGISRLLNKNDFDVVLDIHRDGNDTTSNHYRVNIGGKTAAQIMPVYTEGKKDFMTPAEQRKAHPNWERNATFCLALSTKVSEMYPGLVKRVDRRSNMVFNQDLHPHSIIIEVGCQVNTTAEVTYTARLLGKAIAELLSEHPSFLLD